MRKLAQQKLSDIILNFIPCPPSRCRSVHLVKSFVKAATLFIHLLSQQRVALCSSVWSFATACSLHPPLVATVCGLCGSVWSLLDRRELFRAGNNKAAVQLHEFLGG
ncbi:hypothetical protein AMTRI_Chr01g109160 [Amborella trichopoda]